MSPPRPLPIYLDYHATTPVDPRVVDVVLRTMTSDFGNANSAEHVFGDAAADLVDESRGHVAALVGTYPETVNFTSGSTESIRLAIRHAVSACPKLPLRVAATEVEHHAMLDALADHTERNEVVVRWIPVDRQARLDLGALEDACQAGVDLICVMAANNEVGTVYPVREVGLLAGRFGAQALVDATQASGHIELKADEWNISYLTLSAHKMYGPKGAGALIAPRAFGVSRSRHRVPGTGEGTANVSGIAGLGEACRLSGLEMADHEKQMAAQRDRLEKLLIASTGGLTVNGDRAHRLSNNLHIAIPGVPNNAVIARLRRHVALSSGAACSSGTDEPSHVLRAMGLPHEVQKSALRISTGRYTTDVEIERAADRIASAIASVRDAMRGAMA